MKTYNSFLIYSVLAILIVTVSCNIEPFEGEIPESSGLSCLDAIQNTASATSNLVTATETNYTNVCNDYKDALQDQISACGDTGGTIQAVIDSLGDCSNDTQPDDCETAILASDTALQLLNNASDVDYQDLCNAYKGALESQIVACGDNDGNIQLLIDDLGDCALILPSSGDYWPMAINNSWTYSWQIDGVLQDQYLMEISALEDYQGLPSYVYNSFFGSIQGTDGTGLENVDLKYYTRKNNGDYHLLVGEMTAELSGLYQITQSAYDYIILKDYLDVGNTWDYNFDVITSYSPLDASIPELPDVALNYDMNFEILERDVSVTIEDETFSPVIKLGFKQTTSIVGFPSSNATVDYIYYFAKDVGIVKVEGSIYDADDNITTTVLQQIASYNIN